MSPVLTAAHFSRIEGEQTASIDLSRSKLVWSGLMKLEGLFLTGAGGFDVKVPQEDHE